MVRLPCPAYNWILNDDTKNWHPPYPMTCLAFQWLVTKSCEHKGAPTSSADVYPMQRVGVNGVSGKVLGTQVPRDRDCRQEAATRWKMANTHTTLSSTSNAEHENRRKRERLRGGASSTPENRGNCHIYFVPGATRSRREETSQRAE